MIRFLRNKSENGKANEKTRTGSPCKTWPQCGNGRENTENRSSLSVYLFAWRRSGGTGSEENKEWGLKFKLLAWETRRYSIHLPRREANPKGRTTRFGEKEMCISTLMLDVFIWRSPSTAEQTHPCTCIWKSEMSHLRYSFGNHIHNIFKGIKINEISYREERRVRIPALPTLRHVGPSPCRTTLDTSGSFSFLKCGMLVTASSNGSRRFMTDYMLGRCIVRK